ncbi:MAG: alpha-L-rhamnosidase N-terminal domain-containing protein, partial [Caldilineaceae bacterium]
MTTSSLNFPPHAVWIGSDHPFDLHEAYLNFRSPAGWSLAEKPAQAQLFITADSRYKLWINGQFVARGPARSYPHAQQVDCLEVAAYLQAGVNTLAVQVYQPGYSHFAYLQRGAAGLLAHLVCDGLSALATDLHWRVQRDRSFAANVPRVSIYGTGVEERDLNLAENWMAPDHDDAKWAAPRLVAPVDGYPWTALHPRGVPL